MVNFICFYYPIDFDAEFSLSSLNHTPQLSDSDYATETDGKPFILMKEWVLVPGGRITKLCKDNKPLTKVGKIA